MYIFEYHTPYVMNMYIIKKKKVNLDFQNSTSKIVKKNHSFKTWKP